MTKTKGYLNGFPFEFDDDPPPRKKNTKPHPAGVTWKNCCHRAAGCVACEQELQAEGFYSIQDEIAQSEKGQRPKG